MTERKLCYSTYGGHLDVPHYPEPKRDRQPVTTMKENADMNDINDIIAWEQGEMTYAEEIVFFAKLIKTGLAWSLQGMYGRRAASLIDSGEITPSGDVVE